MYRPPLSEDQLKGGTPNDIILCQGQVIGDTALNVLFFDEQGRSVTPFFISYKVGFLSGEEPMQELHLIGSENRRPLEMRTGLIRPNFQVGDKWYTGDYCLIWVYRVNEDDDLQERKIPFKVITTGIYDVKPSPSSTNDIQATVIIVP